MNKLSFDFSTEQWRFLAVLDAMDSTIHISILDQLAPLTTSQLVDILKKTADFGLLKHKNKEAFFLEKPLPPTVAEKIKKINSPKNISSLVDSIFVKKIDCKLDPHILIHLLDLSERSIEAGRLECELSDIELSKGNIVIAQKLLLNAINRLEKHEQTKDLSSMFISKTLKFSELCYESGRDINKLGEILNTAYKLAVKLGDKRSIALIDLHVGRYYFLNGRMENESLQALSAGLEKVKELGDDDIFIQSAQFIALLYFMKGQFRETIRHLEHLEYALDVTEKIIPPQTYMLFGYSAMYLGQFHRAFGFLDSNIYLAEEKCNKTLSSVLRGILGTTMIMVKKYQEAEFHLKKARQESEDSFNALAYNHSGGGLAYLYFMKGDLGKSYEILSDTVQKVSQAGFINQYTSPWVYEMLYEFHRLGFRPIPYLNFTDAMQKSLNGINVHLRGVALRLKAKQSMDQGNTDRDEIMSDLQASIECLELSGNYIQLAKTILEMGRLELLHNNKEIAIEYVQKAWHQFGAYAQDLVPDQYKALLGKKQNATDSQYRREDYLRLYSEEMNSLKSNMREEEMLNKTIISTNRYFGAERGGLFWFPKGNYTKKPDLRAAINLTKEEATSAQFQTSMNFVFKSFRTNKPLIINKYHKDNTIEGNNMRSVLCLPIEVQGITCGILYHDNSYNQDAFKFLDHSMLIPLGKRTSSIIDFILTSLKIKEKTEKLSIERFTGQQEIVKSKLIAESQVMREQLIMANQVVGTDTTVLLLGETGTGKGIFAKWLHEKSRRADKPFIVVDCATIPENLVESELFGYEKGAFTGAEKQKIGRVELAHEGTLFLDEIGELPFNLQTKLLKALEEKTFTRVGGGRSIRSDFRLIAATNRNLKEEVAARRFREDLYYRLNVFPICIPPLKERGKDIVVLARYFIDFYAKKYDCTNHILSPKDEEMLMRYSWPGNVRELQNVVERAVILSRDSSFQISILLTETSSGSATIYDDMPSLDELQIRYIKRVFAYTKGKVSGPGGASEILGMKRSSLYSRMKALGITKEEACSLEYSK